jgi:sulfite reductase (NADPH) flavoprotein alpha-component
VLYASETGNGEDLAQRVVPPAAQAAGIRTRIREVDAIDLDELAQLRWVLFIVSTTGQGNVPFDFEGLWDGLIAPDAPTLEHLRFGVLALGDRIYADFCQAGIEVDDRLAELGAHRLVDLVTCDDDYETPASHWLRESIGTVADDMAALTGVPGAHGTAQPSMSDPAPAPTCVAEPLRIPDPAARNDGIARITRVGILSDGDPDREILHCTAALPAGAPRWQVGDSLELLVHNDARLVSAVLEHLRIDPEEPVGDGTTTLPAGQLLSERLELSQLPRSLVEAVHERTGDRGLGRLLASGDGSFARWRRGRDLLALLEEVPQLQADVEDLVRWLRPLQTRAYSISSSPLVDPAQADLTVRTLRWQLGSRLCEGTASGALSRIARDPVEPAEDLEEISVRVRPAPDFHLPEDPAADVVMIGPGVGVAPFRGFLQERRAREDHGRSWLLQGIRERGTDLLFGDEFRALHEEGVLTRYDIAASRADDGAEYVQHLIARLGADLFAWIDGGAHVFVCGDAREMAPAVRLALRAIGSARLGSPEQGSRWMARLRAARRLHEDVY